MKINTNKKIINDLLSRSVSTILPSKETLSTLLENGKQLRVYTGIDPTATYVHLGHSTNYFILKRFHELGHKVIVLIGDFTAMIGDPSDKTSARKQLTKDDVLENLKTFKDQIGKILDFNNTENPIEFRFNNEWLEKLSFKDVVELASHFTVQQMIERDAFEKRLKEQKPLYVHEFFYPLMQGYDSVALEADLEIGGTDQTFNMLAGRTLVREYQNREKFVMVTTLLENPVTGEKLMSKSLGTGIGLDENPTDMYGKTMRLPDEALIQCFIDCTEMSLDEIESIKTQLDTGTNPRDVKMRLAREIVTMYHSEKLALSAEQDFISKFQKKEIPDELEKIIISSETKLIDVLIEKGMIDSKTAWRRLVEDGAVTNLETKEKITDIDFVPQEKTLIKIGKKIFIECVIG
jgi:tyrosyl-tRNA synthetase